MVQRTGFMIQMRSNEGDRHGLIHVTSVLPDARISHPITETVMGNSFGPAGLCRGPPVHLLHVQGQAADGRKKPGESGGWA